MRTVRGDRPLPYHTPTLNCLGSLTELTLGHNGSSFDGTGLANQLGFGNDSKPWLPGGYYVNQPPKTHH